MPIAGDDLELPLLFSVVKFYFYNFIFFTIFTYPIIFVLNHKGIEF